jgi:hypothetical protein
MIHNIMFLKYVFTIQNKFLLRLLNTLTLRLFYPYLCIENDRKKQSIKFD